MKTLQIAFVVCATLAVGCSKKDGDKAGGAATAKPGLAWTPDNYSAMSDKCKKALACCEEMAKAAGAKSDGDFNLRCSGPAMWKDDECEADRKSYSVDTGGSAKPVP